MNKESFEVGLPFMKKAGVDHKINFVEAQASVFLNDLVNDVSPYCLRKKKILKIVWQ